MTWTRVMVTGHRPQHLHPTVRPWVQVELERLAVKLRDGVSGMALGCDLWWADAVVRAGLRLAAHVPFPQQPAKWRPEDQAEWWRLLGHAVQTVTYGSSYDVRLLHARNRGMVDGSDQVVAVWVYGKKGGTHAALEYAVQRGRRPIWVDPESQRTIWPAADVWRQLLAPQPRRRAA
jgi:hypothetical protein